jgi:hypothetical protein
MDKLTSEELVVIKALIMTKIEREKDLIKAYEDNEKIQVIFIESLKELETILKKLSKEEN